MGSEAGDEGVGLRNENSDIQEWVSGGRLVQPRWIGDGQTAIVASERRPPRARRFQKQETPAGGPAGVDGGQKRTCRRFGHREGFVPVAWKQEIASGGRRQLAEPSDRQALIAETSNARLRLKKAQFKRLAWVLHGVSIACISDRPQQRNEPQQHPKSTSGNRLPVPGKGLLHLRSALANSKDTNQEPSHITINYDKRRLKY